MAKVRLKKLPTAIAHSIFVVWSRTIHQNRVKFTELFASSERFCLKHPSSMSKTPSNPPKVRKNSQIPSLDPPWPLHPPFLAPQSSSLPSILLCTTLDAPNPALWPCSPSNARHCRVSELGHWRSLKWSAAEDNRTYL